MNGVKVNRLVVLVSAGRRRKAAVAIGSEMGCVVLSFRGEGGVIVESALACQCRDPRVG